LRTRVLFGEGEHKRSSLPEGSLAWANGDAALGLAEVDHVEGQWKVFVVLDRIPAQQLGRLNGTGRVVPRRLPTSYDGQVVGQPRTEELLLHVTHVTLVAALSSSRSTLTWILKIKSI